MTTLMGDEPVAMPPREPRELAVQFEHGLGDCANFAHLLELYRRRGYRATVDCTPDKAPLFRAAGAIIGGASVEHRWGYPDAVPPAHAWPNPNLYERAQAGQAWRVNKAGHNIGTAPLPPLDLAGPAAWRELSSIQLSLASQYNPEYVRWIDSFLADLPRPIVLVHTHGNTSPEIKSWSAPEALAVYHALLDRLGRSGSLVLLDWDDRLPRVPSYRVRHIGDDQAPADVPSLAYLIEQADLLVGVDSGPLHLARFTDTPALGLWKTHHPCFYSLPRSQTLNLVPRRHDDWDRWTRLEFNTVTSAGDEPSPAEIADLAYALAMENKRPVDVRVDRAVARTRSRGASLSNYVDRHVSFGLVIERLRRMASDRAPVMVETGCIRAAEDWGGAGYSTYLFASLFQSLGKGKLYSIELDRTNCEFARAACQEAAEFVSVHQAHSHQWLADLDGPAQIDVFYSDSLDTNAPGHEESCLREVQLAAPRVARDGLILIDDTVHQAGHWRGKGAQAIPWLCAHGWRIVFAGYQCVLEREGCE